MRTFGASAALSLLAITLVSGCFGGGNDDDGVGGPGSNAAKLTFRSDWDSYALPYEGHDHYDPEQHRGLSTPNFQEVGWNPLISDYYGRSAGGYLCGDTVDTKERRLAAVHGIGTDVAFELADITDAANPQVLGEFIMTRGSSRDVALTPDGNFVAVAVDTPDAGPSPIALANAPLASEAPAVWKSPCNEGPVAVENPFAAAQDEAPWPPGVMLVSVIDPKAPAVVGYYPMPVLGAHSVTIGELDGRVIVIASVTNLATAASYFWFLEVTETPTGTGLSLLSTYVERADSGGAPLVNGHNDGVLQEHPVTGMPLAYLANWHQGFTILDMTDPRLPTAIGRWDDNTQPAVVGVDPNDPVSAALVEDGTGDIHEAIPINTTWGGRHYTFAGQEILSRPTGTPSGLVKVIDTTDPTNPFEVAVWTLPADVQWGEGGVFSTHYLSYYGHTVFVAHYHAGVWAIDLSGLLDGDVSEADKHPPASGVYIPANVSPMPPPDGSYDWTPTIMDAPVLPNGDIVVYDCTSGIYIVRFDESQPAPPKVWDWADA